MKIRFSQISILILLLSQTVYSTSPVPTSFWECSLWATVEDEEWLANSYGKFRIENGTRIEDNGISKAWIHHNHHGWIWVESADLSNLWWYSDSLGWVKIPEFGYPYIYSASFGWLYYLQGTSQPRWFFNYSVSEWRNYPLGYMPTDYFTKEKSPEPVNLVVPAYPPDFSPVDENGTDTYGMTFHFLVDREGKVQRASIFILSTALADRDDVIGAAQRALETSEFSPGLRNNLPATLHHSHRYLVKKND